MFRGLPRAVAFMRRVGKKRSELDVRNFVKNALPTFAEPMRSACKNIRRLVHEGEVLVAIESGDAFEGGSIDPSEISK